MISVHVLVRDLDYQGGDTFDIAGGQFERIGQNARGLQLIEQCRELFGGSRALLWDWLYTRTYPAIPPSRAYANPDDDPSPAGDIPYRSEDLLFAFRLLQPGDISFVAQAIVQDDGGILTQQQYRYFSAIATTHHYAFDHARVAEVEALLDLIRTPAAHSAWFSVAKRFLLYGGAKEFNPYIGELDRIVDLAVALEAVLMFEHDFINRLLKRRTIALLGLNEEQSRPVKRLLGDFYGYRSTIAHGDPLPIADAAAFHQQMQAFELIVRMVMRAALAVIPADDAARRAKLQELAVATDEERLDQLRRTAERLEDAAKRAAVLAAL